jgi:hypothetical protein
LTCWTRQNTSICCDSWSSSIRRVKRGRLERQPSIPSCRACYAGRGAPLARLHHRPMEMNRCQACDHADWSPHDVERRPVPAGVTALRRRGQTAALPWIRSLQYGQVVAPVSAARVGEPPESLRVATLVRRGRLALRRDSGVRRLPPMSGLVPARDGCVRRCVHQVTAVGPGGRPGCA